MVVNGGINMGRNASFVLQGANSAYFNGENSYIDCGNSELFNSLSITAEIWFVPYKITGIQAIISKYQVNQDYEIYVEDSRIHVRFNQLNQDNLDSEILEVGELYHVVVSVNTTHMFLFLNGELSASKQMVYSPRILNSNNLYIGYAKDHGYNYLNADMHFVALYDVCWDAETVADRYNNLTQDIVPDKCILFYDFRSVTNPMIDKSGAGNHGIVYNIRSKINRIRNIRHYYNNFLRSKKINYKNLNGYWREVSL